MDMLIDIHRSSHHVPSGGMKESGIGRETGRWGMAACLEYKTLYLTCDGRLP
jgi:succinate-semialdehyde dehydrogenase / glutarate-semialdehyde dehydrogenase